MRRAAYSVPDAIGATLVRIFAYMGGLGVLAILAASLFRPPASVAAVKPAPPPEWVNVERPHPAFELQMPELASVTTDYAILRRSADGTRKDQLTWGTAGGSGPFVMVEIYRPGSSNEHFIDAASEIAARILPFTITDDVKAAGQIEQQVRHCVARRFRHCRTGNARLQATPLPRLRAALHRSRHANRRLVLQRRK